MKILPPTLRSWRASIARRHDPPVARGRYGYRTYRSCLRWEFGFTCPFCLLHETDFARGGAEGLGVMQIEHFVPVSHDATRINEYINCFYVCLFCNQARRTMVNVAPAAGARLLNPCADVWADHFVVEDDHIEVRDSSVDAAYTHGAYDLNDPRKVKRRRDRREAIEECLELIEQGSSYVAQLLEKATVTQNPSLVDQAKRIGEALHRVWRDLEAYAVVPLDAPVACACGAECDAIPELLEEQTIEMEPPPRRARHRQGP